MGRLAEEITMAATHMITYQGRTQNLYQWAAEVGISPATLHGRIVIRGWDIETAMTKEAGNRGPKVKRRGGERREKITVTPRNGYPKKITCMGRECDKKIISTWPGDRLCPACRAYASSHADDWW